MFDVAAYLERIGYSGSTSPDIETLRALHRRHLITVPFENLDIGLGRTISIDEDAILRKVVGRRRGGFCYELNGAFAALLRALGFQVTLLSARVSRESGEDSPEFDHLALRVDLEQPWLADVGFGELFMEPVTIMPGKVQQDPAGAFQLLASRDRFQLEKLEANDRWKREYSFSLVPYRLEDFSARCLFHQTSPESSFTQNRICTLATTDGRITLSEMKLITTRNGSREERVLSSEEEWIRVLRELFGISL
jgi:N-hydroxyarylamine O-acetyltransferase